MLRYLKQGAAGEVICIVAMVCDLPGRAESKVAVTFAGSARPPLLEGGVISVFTSTLFTSTLFNIKPCSTSTLFNIKPCSTSTLFNIKPCSTSTLFNIKPCSTSTLLFTPSFIRTKLDCLRLLLAQVSIQQFFRKFHTLELVQ